MGRSIGAVIVGLLYALATIWLAQVILFFAVPEEPGADGADSVPETRLVLTVICTFASAIIAGFVTAHVARQAELVHGLALGAVLVALLAVTTLVVETEPAPPWYQLALPAVALPGALLGAALRARVPRPPPPAPPTSAS
jgi:putative membrane protein (TIGR04086 family)